MDGSHGKIAPGFGSALTSVRQYVQMFRRLFGVCCFIEESMSGKDRLSTNSLGILCFVGGSCAELLSVRELNDVADFCAGGKKRVAGELENAFGLDDQMREAVRREILADAKDPTVGSEKRKINGETHPESMDPGTRNEIEAGTLGERIAAQKASAARLARACPFQASREHAAASDVDCRNRPLSQEKPAPLGQNGLNVLVHDPNERTNRADRYHRHDRNKRRQQRVLDEILAVVFPAEGLEQFHHECLSRA